MNNHIDLQNRYRSLPPCSREREQELLEHYQTYHDEQSLDLLVRHNMRFVISMAGKFQHRGLEMDELVAVALDGLVEAINRYQPIDGVRYKLISYAVHYIKQRIIRALDDLVFTVRRPSNIAYLRTSVIKRKNRMEQTLSNVIDDRDVHQDLGLTEFQSNHLDLIMVSMDNELEWEKNEPGNGTYHEVFANQNDQDPLDRLQLESRNELLHQAMQELDPRLRYVIQRYFGFDGDLQHEEEVTLKQIGKELGVTRERARQLKEEAITKLRQKISYTRIQEAYA